MHTNCSRWIAFGAALSVLSLSLVASPALAGHHRWRFTEVFSNSDGTVQYIEMFSANTGEENIGPWGIVADSGPTFSFGTSVLDSDDKFVLIATTGFVNEPGSVAPDYMIGAGFFSAAGDTLRYAGSSDIWTFGAVPSDGVQSLHRDDMSVVTVEPNSPTNFDGNTGSIDLSTSVPSLATWGILLLVGALLVAASGILRRRTGASPA